MPDSWGRNRRLEADLSERSSHVNVIIAARTIARTVDGELSSKSISLIS
jgi:hypothetical protein